MANEASGNEIVLVCVNSENLGMDLEEMRARNATLQEIGEVDEAMRG